MSLMRIFPSRYIQDIELFLQAKYDDHYTFYVYILIQVNEDETDHKCTVVSFGL